MFSQPSRCKVDPTSRHPVQYGTGTDANVDITLPATAGQCWVIGQNGVKFSYGAGTLSGGGMDFTYGAGNTTAFSFDVTSNGYGPDPLHKPLKFPVGQAVRVRLRAGGAGVVGKLTLLDYWLESEPNYAG